MLGDAGNVCVNELVLQVDKPGGVWCAPDGEAASWRLGWWQISHEPERISVCLAWPDGVEPKLHTYMRHRHFDFYWTGGDSAGDFRCLRVLSPQGRWSRVPAPLQDGVFSAAELLAALRDDSAKQALSEAGT